MLCMSSIKKYVPLQDSHAFPIPIRDHSWIIVEPQKAAYVKSKLNPTFIRLGDFLLSFDKAESKI